MFSFVLLPIWWKDAYKDIFEELYGIETVRCTAQLQWTIRYVTNAADFNNVENDWMSMYIVKNNVPELPCLEDAAQLAY